MTGILFCEGENGPGNPECVADCNKQGIPFGVCQFQTHLGNIRCVCTCSNTKIDFIPTHLQCGVNKLNIKNINKPKW